MNILFSSPLYPSSRSPLVFCLLFYVYILINFKKQDPCKTWVKISKVMPQPQVHSPGKGREALRQKVLNLSFKIWYGLTVHIIHFYRQNFQFFKIVPSSQNSSELCKFRAIRPHSPRIRQNSHIFANLFYYVSGTCSGREPWKIPANYADSARFAHIAHESREFRTLRTIIKTYVVDFQISDHRQRTQENWSESTRFRSIRPLITRIPSILQ